jgi:hypothetical protein
MCNTKLMGFKQANIAGALRRAHEILEALDSFGITPQSKEKIVAIMFDDLQIGDEYERTSLQLVRLELFERHLLLEDSNLQAAPAHWHGGFMVEAINHG